MTMEKLKSFVDRIPKIELHAHLNGCVRESTLLELARERGIQLSEHHFADEDDMGQGNDDEMAVCQMYNSRPRSLVDCFDIFLQVGQVVADLDALRRITHEALEDFSHHHVSYIEIRSTPKRLRRSWASQDDMATKRDYIHCILSVFQEFERKEQERYQSQNETDPTCRLPLLARLLVSIDRARTVEEAHENVDLAIELYHSSNPYVVGVDLGGNPLRNDFRDFQGVLIKARKAGLKLTLHCGEVSCANDDDEHDTDPERIRALEEAKALIAFHPDRLGHALLLPPSLLPALAASQVPVECCPTSNVMTLELATSCHGYLVEGLRSHPQLEYWLSSNYPFSVSTDDSGAFNTNPSKELLLLAMAWSLTPEKVEQIILQSIDHAFCDEATKSLLRERMIPHFVHYT
jgi:adenosine deaminase